MQQLQLPVGSAGSASSVKGIVVRKGSVVHMAEPGHIGVYPAIAVFIADSGTIAHLHIFPTFCTPACCAVHTHTAHGYR